MRFFLKSGFLSNNRAVPSLGWSAFIVALLVFSSCAIADEDVLKDLKTSHPRLLLDNGVWKRLQIRRRTEPVLDQILHRIETDATELLSEPTLTYRKEGRRLLSVSREALRRILALSIAYKTDDGRLKADRFKQRAESELLALASFQDWNPSHFLDVAEMTTAFALSYDWLYDDLSVKTRMVLKNAILEKGLKRGDDPSLPGNSWYHQETNWNQVCLAGLAMGALAIADEEPGEARKVLSQVRTYIVHGLKSYAPDGVSPEGPSYWNYGTTYQILLNSSLKSALGTDWNLSQMPGFQATAAYILEVTGPTGAYFNYSDSGEKAELEPALYELANETQEPDLLYFQDRLLRKALKDASSHQDRFFPLIALWAKGFIPPSPPKLPLSWHANGAQPLAIFRSAWDQSDALFLAVKGGTPSLSHAHMDAGSFVLDRDGVRWACDLGSQDYFSLESKNVDLWHRSQNSQRWDVFRIGPLSHNTITIGHQRHRVSGQAKIVQFNGDGPSPKVELDLTGVFLGQASQVTRRFSIINRRQVNILDSLEGLRSGERVHWNFTTRAKVSVKGSIATLKASGKTLRLKLIAPANRKWKVRPADPPPHLYDASNPGVFLLSADFIAPPDGKLVIQVLTD